MRNTLTKELFYPEKKQEIIEYLKDNYNYPMMKDIHFYKDIFYDNNKNVIFEEFSIELELKENFEFLYKNDYISSKYRKTLCGGTVNDLDVKYTCMDFSNILYCAQLKDLPLYRLDKSEETMDYNLEYFSNINFKKKYNDLTKQEKSIIFGCMDLGEKYIDGSEIVADFYKFFSENGRFPFRTERLFKTFEYAKSKMFLSEEQIDEINSIKGESLKRYSHNEYEKLCEFIKVNKRWPYEKESEYKVFSNVCKYFRYGFYNENQISQLDYLYAKYNNSNDSLGEKMINSILTGLGYKIEKQKTFDNLVYKNKLRFDTCINIDGQILLIEYDGPQHYMPIDFFGGEEQFQQTQIRDKIKNKYCEEYGIPLLRISYNNLKDAELLIKRFIDLNIPSNKHSERKI